MAESGVLFDRCISATKQRLKLHKTQSISSESSNTLSRGSLKSFIHMNDVVINDLEAVIRVWYRNHPTILTKFNNKMEWHPMHLAAALGKIELIEEILAKEPRSANAKYCVGANEIVNPLMCAAAVGCLSTMKYLIEHGATFSENPMKEIEWAIIGKNVECFYFVVSRAHFKVTLQPIDLFHFFLMGLLQDDVDIVDAIVNLSKMFSQTVSSDKTLQVSQLIVVRHKDILYFALKKAFFGVAEVLLKEHCQPDDFKLDGSGLILPALHYTILNNTDKVAAELLNLLLLYGAPVDQRDKNGNTALNTATNLGYIKCFFALVQAEGEICVNDMKNLNDRIPNFFKMHLDSLISSNLLTSAPSGEIVSIDVRFMGVINENDYYLNTRSRAEQHFKEVNFLMFVIDDGQDELVLHPVIQTYLEKKWTGFFKTYFFFSYAIYLFQLLCFSNYVTTRFATDNQVDENRSILCNTPDLICPEGELQARNQVLWVFTMIGTYLLIFTRISSFVFGIVLGTFKTQIIQHVYEVFLVGFIIGCVIPIDETSSDSRKQQRATAAVAILHAWCYCLFYLARHSSLGIYVEMLGKVLLNFTIFFLTYTSFLIGYALAFSVLFKGKDPFHTMHTSAKEVVKMMLGENDFNTESDLEILTNIMYISFIVIVTVALINLLIGLSVYDIQGLIESSKLNKSIRQIRYMHSIESVLYSKVASFCCPRVVESYLKRRIRHDHDKIIHIYPNTAQHRHLPYAQDALHIARKNCRDSKY